VAGFIGSHLAERLLEEGYEVLGVDCFTDYYPRRIKERNLGQLHAAPGFGFVEANLCSVDLQPLFEGTSAVLHLAAQAGVRASWGQNFCVYAENNILATQRLLEAAKDHGVDRFVYASSSSVYGDTPDLPMREDSRLRPVSPYGVTKLAGEHLCMLYHTNHGIPTVATRYFTVYGPRQRPDMAFHRFIKAIRDGETISVYGDGEQTRDFTFVEDAVQATVLVLQSDAVGTVFNVGGGSRITVNETIAMLEPIIGKRALIQHQPAQPGDVRHTLSDTSRAQQLLGFAPRADLQKGLEAEVAWLLGQA
jgi:UDP-glucose 4-epimerase